jgi:pimeloyl-ACP methyl ester carboxylesterase
MRNHGQSAWQDSQSYPDMAQDLYEVIQSLGGQADVLGHSMGGKAAMVLALQHPQMLRRLLIADIAPVAYQHSQNSLIDAMRQIDLTQVTTRGDADRQLAQFVDTPAVRAFLLQSLDVKSKKWRLNLDILERDMALIVGFPDIKGQFSGPTLFLSGALSDYVQAKHRPLIKAFFPKAKQAKIPQTGHWLHAEKPRDFEATARVFLNS